MDKNIKLELLNLLADNYPNWVNIRPLINKHRIKNNFTRQDFSVLLYSLQSKKFIMTQNVIALSYHKQDVYDDESDITAKIEPDGLDEYHKLKNIYSPEPSSVTNNTIYADKNKGSIIQSSSNFDNRPRINPTIVQNIDAPKTGTKTSIGKFLMNNIVVVIITTVIGGLIVGYLLHLFGWV